MTISIVLPYYNAAPFLADCLNSIAAQTWTDFELLAINDGSDDSGPAIVNDFARRDRRCTALDIQHSGIVAALNTGINAAAGDLIVRMDADDIMHPRRLEMLVEFSRGLPADFIVGSRVQSEIPEGADDRLQRYLDWSNSLLTSAALRNELFVDATIVHPTMCFPRRTILLLGAYREVDWPEDYDLLQRAVHAGLPLFKLSDVLLVKKDHGKSLSRLDARYHRSAMLKAKAHFLLKQEEVQNRPMTIIGGGGVARELAGFLGELGRPPHLFVDSKQQSGARTIMGVEAVGIDVAQPANTLAGPVREGHFFLLCIGNDRARQAVEQTLNELNRRVWTDYLRIV